MVSCRVFSRESMDSEPGVCFTCFPSSKSDPETSLRVESVEWSSDVKLSGDVFSEERWLDLTMKNWI